MKQFRLLSFTLLLSNVILAQDLRFFTKRDYNDIVKNMVSYVSYRYFTDSVPPVDSRNFFKYILPLPSDNEYLPLTFKRYDTIYSSSDTIEIFEMFSDYYSIQLKDSAIRVIPNRYFYTKPTQHALLGKSKRLGELYFISGYLFLDPCEFMYKAGNENWTESTLVNYVEARYHNYKPSRTTFKNGKVIFYSLFYENSFVIYVNEDGVLSEPIPKEN